MDRDYEASSMENLVEFAGRACYQSFHRPNPETNTTDKYLKRTLFEQGHWSIAEHASVTFYITGVSRAFTHELVRHRHLSYSQLSQRFVNEEDASFVIPPAMSEDESLKSALEMDLEGALDYYKYAVERLLDQGYTRKQAREAARAVLPNIVETKIVVTGNLRAWHEFCARRMQPDADAEMQQVATMIYESLNTLAPSIFPEIEEEEEEVPLEARAEFLRALPEGSIVQTPASEYVKHGAWLNLADTGEDEYLTSHHVAMDGEVVLLYRGDA
ncbi:FAD-dependent thymidylate synthase [Corynebacterium coyleae]|nr:FAD-dependent thymidylate synthase [Corynebacterium coyleae]UBI10000.1 FAD-dependent thymidylate synthase [Corynebacterium coyleae]